MRWVLDTDPNPRSKVILIGALLGCEGGLAGAIAENLGDTQLTLSILEYAAWGASYGVVGIYLFGALISWTGKWIGGQARDVADIRAALAWGSVPLACSGLLLWVAELALFKKQWFTSPRFVFGYTLVGNAVTVWCVLVLSKCLGEAQGFSAWRALGNTMLAILLLIVVLVLIVTLVVVVLGWQI